MYSALDTNNGSMKYSLCSQHFSLLYGVFLAYWPTSKRFMLV